MIDYGLFKFACPVYTGGRWFVRACGLAGLGEQVGKPFAEREGFAEPWRVTLVRHPCDWLAIFYAEIIGLGSSANKILPWGALPRGSFSKFVGSCLGSWPGEVGELYNRYRAETVLRIEDCPHALVEFLESVGVPKAMRDRVKSFKPKLPWMPNWPKRLRQAMLEVEREACEAYEYR